MRQLASEYGVSDVALNKTCKKLGVPTPPRGYWLRDPVAREEDRVALPPRPNGVPEEIAGLVSALRGVPVDQLLDLAIAKMRAALPAGTSVPRAQPVKFQLVPVQPREKSTP